MPNPHSGLGGVGEMGLGQGLCGSTAAVIQIGYRKILTHFFYDREKFVLIYCLESFDFINLSNSIPLKWFKVHIAKSLHPHLCRIFLQ